MVEQGFSARTAVVTGAVSGIGAAISREMAARGATVMALEVDAAALDVRVDAIAAKGGTVDDVSGLACFLLSGRARFIIGHHHVGGGGHSAQ